MRLDERDYPVCAALKQVHEFHAAPLVDCRMLKSAWEGRLVTGTADRQRGPHSNTEHNGLIDELEIIPTIEGLNGR